MPAQVVEWCYYCEHTAAFPDNQEVHGHVLSGTLGREQDGSMDIED